jgi:two-component system sensor histidine kinase RegB
MNHLAARHLGAARHADVEPVGLSWLVTVRWTTPVAGAGAMLAGQRALDVSAPLGPAVALLVACVVSNLWLTWRVRSRPAPHLPTLAGAWLCADALLISWLLWRSGGVLNPASIFYLVLIVVAALVLGRAWTWVVTSISAGAYAALFLVPPVELRAAQAMHPEIAVHMGGMWLAFAGTALIIAVLVARLATAVERRDRALAALRERTARVDRLVSLATLAAGAAHELSTPLATIAVAARELERSLAEGQRNPEWHRDATLIRREAARCRQILDGMAAGSGDTIGELPAPAAISEIIVAARDKLSPAERDRIILEVAEDLRVIWPGRVVARALANLLQNAVQASKAETRVLLRADVGDGVVRVSVIDQGAGMSADDLARAGEPFFSMKPAGAGTGLGLFVARSSVEQLGGRLELESLVGRGTTATIVLPADVVAQRAEVNG